MTLKELRRNAQNKLMERPDIMSPELDADLIIMHVLELSKEELLIKDIKVPDALAIEVNAYVNRRLAGMPVQYIIGRCEFMSLEFEVNKSTLIPRQDTETLVEAVIARYKGSAVQPRILDIGCGSGCVGISLVYYLSGAFVTELDISDGALRVAKRNAERHRVGGRMRFVHGNVFDGVSGEYDVIVSNPPYIKTDDIFLLQREVAEQEPLEALDGGEDGLKFYRFIIENIFPVRGGLIAFEVGIGQAEAVADMLYRRGYNNIEITPDLSGIDRVVTGIF